MLDALVKAKRTELGGDGADTKSGQAISFPEPEPWPNPVDGATMLDDISKAIAKHVIMAAHSSDACALWAASTFLTRLHDGFAPAGVLIAGERMRENHSA